MIRSGLAHTFGWLRRIDLEEEHVARAIRERTVVLRPADAATASSQIWERPDATLFLCNGEPVLARSQNSAWPVPAAENRVSMTPWCRGPP
jgi:hypothetical protein